METVTIADVGRVVTGRTPLTKKPEFYGADYPFITPSDITDVTPFVQPERFISEAGREKHRTAMIPKDTVCFTCIASIGKMCIADCLSLTNQQINSIIVNKGKFAPRYIYYLLRTETERIAGIASGAATPIINKSMFSEIKLDVHILSVQQKIAFILSTYDDLIQNNLRRIKILEEMAQVLYREWFVKFHFPGHEKVKFVDSPLGKIPEGWELIPMEHVCSRITDGAHRSPKSVEEGFSMASVKDMHDWGINVESCRKISAEEFQNLERNDCIMRKDDVLIAKDGSYLKHCFVVEENLDIALLSSIAMLRPNEKMNHHLLAMTLKNPKTKARMKGYVSGAALPRIILKEFRQFLIILPPAELQKKWARLACSNIVLCWNLVKKNKNLRQTRDFLLPKLISGELDVSDLNIKIPKETS